MAQGNFDNAIEMIRINELENFEIYTGKENASTALFKSNPERDLDSNIEQARSIMRSCHGDYFTLVSWRGNNKTVNKFRFVFDNLIHTSVGSSSGTATPATVGVPSELVDQQIQAAIDRLQLDYERKDIDRRENDLRDRERDFERNRDSVLGRIMNVVGGVINQYPQLAVAGIPEGDDAPSEATTLAAEPTDDATAHLEQLLSRWAEVDPDWLQLLEKIVNMATSQDPKYTIAKSML